MKDYVAFDLETTGLSQIQIRLLKLELLRSEMGRSVESITVSFIQRSKSVIYHQFGNRNQQGYVKEGIPLKEGVEEFCGI